MRVVIDTNILVSFAIRPNPDFEKLFEHISSHGLSLVSDETIAELFDVLSRDKFRKYIPLGHAALGCPISQADAQIAAIARSRGAALATRNVPDFEGCGVEVINPWTA